MFNPLSEDNLEKIMALMLAKERALASERGPATGL